MSPLEQVKKFSVGQLAALVHALGGPEAVEKVLRDNGLREQVTDLIIAAKSAGAETFRATCDYTMPSYAELMLAFNWVNPWYKKMEFKMIDICKSINRETREIEFVYVRTDSSASIKDVPAEMARRNLRPAIYEEGLSFSKTHPNEQRKFPIYVIGSFSVSPFIQYYVACLYSICDERLLNLHHVEDDRCDDCRFLAVRE